MKLDKFQQQAADCSMNAVVSAGAGSGKTTVLAERFLRLVAGNHAQVSEILTLTFTRKAAAEMYDRIYRLLLDNRDNEAAATAVADFDKACISTLDSFCSRIARDCCHSFGLTSSFKTDEDAVGKLARDVSLDFILANAEDSCLKEFIYINGFENVWQNFFIRISMNYLSFGAPKDFMQIYTRQMETAEAALDRLTVKIRNCVNEILLIETDLGSVKKEQEKLAGFDVSSSGELKQQLNMLNLKKPGGASKKPEVLQCKELIDELRDAAASAAELFDTLDNRDLLEGLFRLTADFQEELFSRKRTAGLLGFHDVLTIAVAGLRQDKALRRYYKGLFRFIMIDEFQDNNSLQKELLYLLAEKEGFEGDEVPSAEDLNPRKLFFVGDEKQSIYRFRGADVSVFKQLSGEIKAAGGVSLSLNKNYRSEPGLIDFFNRVFSHVMRDSSESYQASFIPLQSRAAVLETGPDIRLLYKPYEPELPEDSLSAEESEAHEIARYILEAEGRLKVSDEGGTRTAEYSDFALLFRSGTNQKTYEQVFRARGIPYTVHSVRSLFQEAPVNDIYNLLQICMYPDDRIASAAFLRSPFINLSDLSTAEFLMSGSRIFSGGAEQYCVTPRDLEKYRHAKNLYEDVQSIIDREPIASVITRIWFKSGYRYLILSDSSQHGYLEYYDYLRELAAGFDRRSQPMAEFLDNVRENLGEYRKLEDLKVLGYEAGGVKIMPIHQSKGLEFPVVIIANAGNTGVSDLGGAAPAFVSETDGLSFNLVNDSGRTNYFYSRGKEEHRARDQAELRRLLYVALTRAENHLVISGCHGKNNRSGERSMLNMFLSSLGWAEKTDAAECVGLSSYIRRIENRQWQDSVKFKRSTADMDAAELMYSKAAAIEYNPSVNEYSATALNDLCRSASENPAEAGSVQPLSAGVEKILSGGGLEAEFGTFCHRLIELVIKDGNGKAPSDFILQPEIVEQFFRKLPEDKKNLMLQTGASLSECFFESGIWKKAEKAVSFDSELPFTAVREYNGERVYVNGVIDLVFETEDGISIVDFKTDRRIVPGEYDLQLQIYIDAAEAIYDRPAECSLYYLRSGTEIKIK